MHRGHATMPLQYNSIQSFAPSLYCVSSIHLNTPIRSNGHRPDSTRCATFGRAAVICPNGLYMCFAPPPGLLPITNSASCAPIPPTSTIPYLTIKTDNIRNSTPPSSNTTFQTNTPPFTLDLCIYLYIRFIVNLHLSQPFPVSSNRIRLTLYMFYSSLQIPYNIILCSPTLSQHH